MEGPGSPRPAQVQFRAPTLAAMPPHSASGSLLTGDLSAAATVSTTVGSGYGANPTANVTLQDFGIITLPTGMSSASVTFGASGVSATASAPYRYRGEPIPTS